MSKKLFKTVGEGGAHAHRINPNISKTEKDGKHKHLFFISDRILMTDLSGEHDHNINLKTGKVLPENQMHLHGVAVRTSDGELRFTTSESEGHAHELQSNLTTLSGVHQHVVQIMDEQYVSLVPSDLIDEVLEASKSVKQFKNLNLRKSDDPLEVNFSMVKRLNEPQFKTILRSGIEKSLIKRMTTLSEGLRIESLILSNQRFSDIGLATNFVLEQGLNIKQSNVLNEQGLFTFQVMSRDSFEETTLQRIRITEGVEAVIGFLAEREEDQDRTINEATDVQQSKSSLVTWHSHEAISGSFQNLLDEISAKFDINRKFVCVDYPRNGLVKYVEENMEVVSAAYNDIMDDNYKSVVSMQAESEEMDVFVTDFGQSKSMIFFFDDEEEMQKVYGTDTVDYAPGTYKVKQTMCGYTLIPMNISGTEEPIFDDNIIASLENDTETFFAKRDFFINNPVQQIAHKRGIFMIGKPGNGKTTFIKHYLNKTTKENGRYGILIDCSDGFSADIGKFLSETLHDKEKVIALEDCDSVAESSYQRASFLNFIDGIDSMDKTLFIATSNHPEKLDEAIMNRRSRFDKKYFIDLPSEKMRIKFLERFFPDMEEDDLIENAKQTEGFSGADFKEIFVLQNLQDITAEKAIELLHEQINMVYKNKVDYTDSIKALLFEGLQSKKNGATIVGTDKDIKMAKKKNLKDKFKNVMDAYDAEYEVIDEEIIEDDDQDRFKCAYEFATKSVEKRLITGPVLIPDNIDLQDDIVNADEIEKAAFGYMIKLAFRDDPDYLKELGFSETEKAGERGFQHVDFSRKMAVVETFIAPVDFELNGRTITKGTWVMTMKVLDDEIWNLVKAGKITGFSIGGRSKSRPVKNKE